jgi:hypothetical protein
MLLWFTTLQVDLILYVGGDGTLFEGLQVRRCWCGTGTQANRIQGSHLPLEIMYVVRSTAWLCSVVHALPLCTPMCLKMHVEHAIISRHCMCWSLLYDWLPQSAQRTACTYINCPPCINASDAFMRRCQRQWGVLAMQGLLGRPDWQRAARIPFSCVPTGSGNGMAASLGLWDADTAAYSVCKGFMHDVDVASILQPPATR